MPAERYYIDSKLHTGDNIELQDHEFHHLAHVMRTKIGEVVELVNGQGQLAQTLVQRIAKRVCYMQIESVTEEPKPAFEIILAQSIPRVNRLDFIIEKGVELGLTQLWLLPAKHSERKSFNEQQLEKMKMQMITAMKQCGRLYLPELHLMQPIAKYDKLPYPSYFGDLDPEAPSFLKEWKRDGQKGCIILIGPESGFTEDEIAHLRKIDAHGIKLHPNVLRTDTAALAALTLFTHSLYYDLGN